MPTINTLQAVIGVLSTIVGGLGVKLYNTYLTSQEQQHSLSQELRQELRSMLKKERGERKAIAERLDTVENRLDEERELRHKAERQNDILQRKLDLVIRLLNDMREQQGMERLKSDEIALLALENKPENNDTAPQ